MFNMRTPEPVRYEKSIGRDNISYYDIKQLDFRGLTMLFDGHEIEFNCRRNRQNYQGRI